MVVDGLSSRTRGLWLLLWQGGGTAKRISAAATDCGVVVLEQGMGRGCCGCSGSDQRRERGGRRRWLWSELVGAAGSALAEEVLGAGRRALGAEMKKEQVEAEEGGGCSSVLGTRGGGDGKRMAGGEKEEGVGRRRDLGLRAWPRRFRRRVAKTWRRRQRGAGRGGARELGWLAVDDREAAVAASLCSWGGGGVGRSSTRRVWVEEMEVELAVVVVGGGWERKRERNRDERGLGEKERELVKK